MDLINTHGIDRGCEVRLSKGWTHTLHPVQVGQVRLAQSSLVQALL